MGRGSARHLAALPVVLFGLALPGCGSDGPTTPTRTLLTQGQVAFPRPELTPGLQPLYAVVNFATPARGDLEITADWGNAANIFTLNLRQGTCGVTNHIDCALLVSGAEGARPARVMLAAASAGSYSLDVLLIPEAGLFFPETVSYQVFLTN